MSWRPIDLAPRDGTDLVVLFRSSLTGALSAAVAKWSRGEWERSSDAGSGEVAGDVAFAWMELPEDAFHVGKLRPR